MTTRLDPQGPAPLVHADPAAYRSTAQPTRPFQAVMTAGAAAVIGGAEAAVQRLPGGPILAAAFRPQSAQPVLTGGGAPATTPEGYPVAGSGTGVTGAGVAGAGNGTGSLDVLLASSAHDGECAGNCALHTSAHWSVNECDAFFRESRCNSS